MRLLAAFILLLLSASPLRATVVLDQEYLAVLDGRTPTIVSVGNIQTNIGNFTNTSIVQTFTAGTAGNLTMLQFQAANLNAFQGTLTMSLIDGDYAAGARNILTTSTLDFSQMASSSPTTWPMIDFAVDSAGYYVDPGQRYSVLFNADVYGPTNFVALLLGTVTLQPDLTPLPGSLISTGYLGGETLAYREGNFVPAPDDFANADVGFRSYVDTVPRGVSAVPEPAVWATLICGFGLLGAQLRLSKKRSPLRAS